jgi:hypothetical protein
LTRRAFGRALFAFHAVLALACHNDGTPAGPSPPLPEPPPVAGLQCGVERWSVKTLSDRDATRVDVAASTRTTVALLSGLAPQCGGGPDQRIYPQELLVFEADAILQAVKREDDRDLHLILQDPESPSDTVIAELPDTACMGAAQSPYIVTLAQAYFDFLALLPPGTTDVRAAAGRRVRVRGVGFFDFPHGQTGRSRSCIELHPIISIAPI